MWVVKRVQHWDSLEIAQTGRFQIPFPITLKNAPGWPNGFLPVFNQYDEALAWCDGNPDDIQEIAYKHEVTA